MPHAGAQLRSLLAGAGGHANTRACDNAADWCSRQAKQMRLRIEYALASDKVGAALSGVGGTMVGVPDVDRFGAAQLRELGQLEGGLYADAYAHPDVRTQQTMAQIGADLRRHTRDAAYLKGFFGAAPPGSAGKLAYQLHRQYKDGKTVLDETDKKILGDFGTALAALSRSDETAAPRALGRPGEDMPGQGLLVSKSDGRWHSHVLAQLGQAALRWCQQFHS